MLTHTSLSLQRHGAWLPSDHRTQQEWLSRQVDHVDKQHKAGKKKPLSPALQEFKELVSLPAYPEVIS